MSVITVDVGIQSIQHNMSEKFPEQNSLDSMEGLPRQDIPVVSTEEKSIEVPIEQKKKKEGVAQEQTKEDALAKVRAELGVERGGMQAKETVEAEGAKIPETMKFPSPEEALSIIAKDFPEFEGTKIALLGQGMGAITFEVNGEYLFRFPSLQTAKKEFPIGLEGKTKAEIPRIEYRGKERNYIGYRKIAGDVLTRKVLEALTDSEKEQLGKDMALFAYQMHTGLSPEEAEKQGFARRPMDEESRKEIENFVKKEFEGDLQAYFIKALSHSAELESAPHKEVALHGDLNLGNELLDPATKRLKGVIDFGNAIGDVHKEFAIMRLQDPLVAEAMTKEYERLSGEALSRETIQTYGVARELKFLLGRQKRGEQDKETTKYRRNQLIARVSGIA